MIHYFVPGQLVTVQSRSHGTPVFRHQAVLHLAGSGGCIVVLDDGTRWRHDGNPYGSHARFSRYGEHLITRKDGLDREADHAEEQCRQALRRRWREFVDQIGLLSVQADRAKAIALLTETVDWLRSLEDRP